MIRTAAEVEMRDSFAQLIIKIAGYAAACGISAPITPNYPYCKVEIVVPLCEDSPVEYNIELRNRNGRGDIVLEAPSGKTYRNAVALEHLAAMMDALSTAHPYLVQHLSELS